MPDAKKHLNFRPNLGFLQKHISLLFWLLLLVLLIGEGLVVKGSVDYVTRADTAPVVVAHTAGNGIDFEDYQKVVDRIQRAETFQPSVENVRNPFNPDSVPPAQSAPAPAASSTPDAASSTLPIVNMLR